MNRASAVTHVKSWWRRFLLRFGLVRAEYGYACGRAWIEVNGVTFFQGDTADVRCRDEAIDAAIERIFK